MAAIADEVVEIVAVQERLGRLLGALYSQLAPARRAERGGSP